MTDKRILVCSFCGKKSTEVEVMLAGNECHICNECVDRAIVAIADFRIKQREKTNLSTGKQHHES